MENTLDLIKIKTELLASIEATTQARSNFSLKNFVVGEHATNERQFSQCVLELHVKLNNIRRDQIKVEKLKRRLKVEEDNLEIELINLEIEEINFSLLSQMREAGTLYSIYSTSKKYTYQQIQEAEEEYWYKRLSKQAMLDVASHGRISVGNLDALRMAKIVDDNFTEEFVKLGMTEPRELK